MKDKENHSKNDCCSMCEDFNEAMEKKDEKKDKKNSSWNWKIPLLAIVLVLGIVGIVKYGILKTKDQSLSIKESINIVKEPKTKAPQIDSFAPDFTTEDLNGNSVSLSDFRGKKPVLLVFWATWCVYCAKELPDLKTFTKEHIDEIQVIAMGSGEVKDTIENYIEEKDINFLMLLDEKKEIWNSYLVRGTPSHFIIDKQGKIMSMRPGLSSLDNLETMLKMVNQ